jgi:hypothetical protein
MMLRRIAVIEPRNQRLFYKTISDRDISRAAGPELTAHTVIKHNEPSYGLFCNATMQATAPEYYGLDGQLCHGPGVLYAFDQEGATVDIPRSHPQPLWLGPLDNAIAAASAGMIFKKGE